MRICLVRMLNNDLLAPPTLMESALNSICPWLNGYYFLDALEDHPPFQFRFFPVDLRECLPFRDFLRVYSYGNSLACTDYPRKII